MSDAPWWYAQVMTLAAGILATFAAMRNHDRSILMSHVTAERKSWREKIRELVAEIVRLSASEKTTHNEIGPAQI